MAIKNVPNKLNLTSRGDKVLNGAWLLKIPFSYLDKEGNIINFTIYEEVEVYDVELGEWFEGTREELVKDSNVSISFLPFVLIISIFFSWLLPPHQLEVVLLYKAR